MSSPSIGAGSSKAPQHTPTPQAKSKKEVLYQKIAEYTVEVINALGEALAAEKNTHTVDENGEFLHTLRLNPKTFMQKYNNAEENLSKLTPEFHAFYQLTLKSVVTETHKRQRLEKTLLGIEQIVNIEDSKVVKQTILDVLEKHKKK